MVATVYGNDDRQYALIPTVVQTGAYTLNPNELAPCDSTGGAFTLTLPAAPTDRTLAGAKLINGTNTVTVMCAGSDVINIAGGSTSTTLTAVSQGLVLQYDADFGIWYGIMNSGSSGGGGGGVTTFNGRSGAVAPASADYSFSQISGTIASAQVPTLNQNTSGTAAGLSATLPIAEGGTGQTGATAAFNALSPTTTLGDTLSNDGTNDTRIAGNTTATKKFFTQTGTGSVSAAPGWNTIAAGDVPTLNQSTTGSAASCTGNAATATNLAGGATFPAYTAPKVVSLTDASTVAINAALGNDLRLTMTSGVGSTRALGAPSNAVDGQRIDIMVTQDSSGSRLLTYNAAFEFSTGLPSPTLSTGANLTDILGFIYNAAKSKWFFIAFLNGFA